MTTIDTYTVVWANLDHNGIGSDGSRHRRDIGLNVLTKLRPHLLLRQEETRAWDNDQALMKEEAQRLALVPVLSPLTTDTRNPVAVLYHPDAFDPVGEPVTWKTGMWRPLHFPMLRPKAAPTARPFAAVSVHLCAHDPELRAMTAQRLTSLAEHGRSALIAGDMNSYPHRPEPTMLPDWSQVTDAVHYQQRTLPVATGRISDTEPDRILTGVTPAGNSVFTDLAWHAHHELGQRIPNPLAPTATYWRNQEQGTPQRIDRGYATEDIASALHSVEIIATNEVQQASDHAFALARFTAATLHHALTQPRQPYAATPFANAA